MFPPSFRASPVAQRIASSFASSLALIEGRPAVILTEREEAKATEWEWRDPDTYPSRRRFRESYPGCAGVPGLRRFCASCGGRRDTCPTPTPTTPFMLCSAPNIGVSSFPKNALSVSARSASPVRSRRRNERCPPHPLLLCSESGHRLSRTPFCRCGRRCDFESFPSVRPG
jgi:hypothetical protein